MNSPQKALSIHDFETISVLGKGSYAKVVLVRKKDNQRVYAMKILKKKNIKKQKQQEHTMTERLILSECDHPFIIKMEHSFQNEKKLFMALEFCQGGELFYLLSKAHKFGEEMCQFYATQIVLALEYLHNKDIIYRDLKPENVLLDQHGYIKLTDFGLAKRNMNIQNAKSVCGTPEYLAPEVLLKQGHGKPVDWWALGCLIYEMITGRPPFYTDNRNRLFGMIKKEEVLYPSNVKISENLKDFLKSLFQKDPTKRIGSDGTYQIKSHPWFEKVQWNQINSKNIKPPFMPKIQDEVDYSNFEKEYTEEVIHSHSDGSVKESFIDWSYDNSGILEVQDICQLQDEVIVDDSLCNGDQIQNEKQKEKQQIPVNQQIDQKIINQQFQKLNEGSVEQESLQKKAESISQLK